MWFEGGGDLLSLKRHGSSSSAAKFYFEGSINIKIEISSELFDVTIEKSSTPWPQDIVQENNWSSTSTSTTISQHDVLIRGVHIYKNSNHNMRIFSITTWKLYWKIKVSSEYNPQFLPLLYSER